MQRVIGGVEDEGWRFVAMTRLIPFIPFNALNYALGLTRIRLVSYVAASVVFMAPGAAAYAYLGHAGRSLATGDGDLVQNALLGLAVLGLIGFMPRLIKRFMKGRKAAQEQAEQSGPGDGYSRRRAARIAVNTTSRAGLMRRAQRHWHEGEQGGDSESELNEHRRRRRVKRNPRRRWS